MHKPETLPSSEFHITAPMRQFLDYFGRWVHAGAFEPRRRKPRHCCFCRTGRWVAMKSPRCWEISKAKATSALNDLDGWDMARKNEDGCWLTSSEPWDLLFTALESRQQRKIAPALEILRQCTADARSDAATPATVRRRIAVS